MSIRRISPPASRPEAPCWWRPRGAAAGEAGKPPRRDSWSEFAQPDQYQDCRWRQVSASSPDPGELLKKRCYTGITMRAREERVPYHQGGALEPELQR